MVDSGAGYNLQTLKDHFLFLAEGAFTKKSSSSITDAQVLSYLNAAQDEITNLLKLPDTAATALNLVQGTSAYDLPWNISAEQVRAVFVRDRTYTAANGDRTKLSALGMALASSSFDLYNVAATTQGNVEAFTRNPTNPRQILILPPPDYSSTGGVEIYYTFRPSRLHRIYKPTGVTATVGYNDDTVQLSATPATGLILPGDEFGVTSLVNMDGTAAPDQSPVRWYTVESIIGDILTLTQPFDQPAVAAVSFITAQVPDLEKHYPGRMQLIQSDMALTYYLRASVPQQSMELKASVIQQLDTFIDNLPDERTLTDQPGRYTNFFSLGT